MVNPTISPKTNIAGTTRADTHAAPEHVSAQAHCWAQGSGGAHCHLYRRDGGHGKPVQLLKRVQGAYNTSQLVQACWQRSKTPVLALPRGQRQCHCSLSLDGLAQPP